MISRITSNVFVFAKNIFEPSFAYLGFALAIIGAAIYWRYQNYVASLVGRVQKLETDLENIVVQSANSAILFPRATTVDEWKERVLWRLKQLNDEAQNLPSDFSGKAVEFKMKMQVIIEGTETSFKAKFTQKHPITKDPTPSSDASGLEKELRALDWQELVIKFEKDLDIHQDLTDLPDVLDRLKTYQLVLSEQLFQICNVEKKPELFSFLERVHLIGRRLTPEGTEIDSTLPLSNSPTISGLIWAQNNCYLATALQFLRRLNLVDKFDPNQNNRHSDLTTKIQRSVFNILNLMNTGQPISLHQGAELQNLITAAKINDGALNAQNDALEVAMTLLEFVGYQLPSGCQLTRLRDGNCDINPYRPILFTLPDIELNVGDAIQNLTRDNVEDVEDYGEITRKVTILPELMLVTFSCHGGSPQLINHDEFDDPLNEGHYYQLVFGMENNAGFTGESTYGHWIAHFRDEHNQWFKANGNKIDPITTGAPNGIRYGCYIRKKR
jgi:hypothetical protein